MKSMIKIELEKAAVRLENQYNAIVALKTKIEKLGTELDHLEAGFQKTVHSIEDLGTKGNRRDGKPETPETTRTRESYNEELLKEKLRLTKQILDSKTPNAWIYVQSMLPDYLKDENLQ